MTSHFPPSTTRQVPLDILESIDAIVAYLWVDESADYEDEGRPEGHVFEHLERVNVWLSLKEGRR